MPGVRKDHLLLPGLLLYVPGRLPRGDWDYTGISLAFLTYIKIFGYQESCGKMPSQICEELSRIRPEIQNRLKMRGPPCCWKMT